MFEKYTIKKEDNISSLANKFKIDGQILLDINNIPFSDMIREGVDIIVPNLNKNYYSYYIVEKGDTLYSIAKKYDVSPKLIANMNGIKENEYIYPNQELLIPNKDYFYYITIKGDTLNLVSQKLNQSTDELSKINTIYLLEDQLIISKKP